MASRATFLLLYSEPSVRATRVSESSHAFLFTSSSGFQGVPDHRRSTLPLQLRTFLVALAAPYTPENTPSCLEARRSLGKASRAHDGVQCFRAQLARWRRQRDHCHQLACRVVAVRASGTEGEELEEEAVPIEYRTSTQIRRCKHPCRRQTTASASSTSSRHQDDGGYHHSSSS